MKGARNWLLLLYFYLALIFMELLLRAFTVGGAVFSLGTAILLLFALPFAALFALASSCFRPKLNRIFAIFLLGLAAGIFSSQVVYFGIFKTFYTIYSAANAGQVWQFWREALVGIANKSPHIVTLFLPMAALWIFGRKRFSFENISWGPRTVLILLVFIGQISGIALVGAGERQQVCAYTLYYEKSIPTYSVQRLGLITTMRIDAQRLLTGWSPIIVAPPVEDMPVWDPPPKVEVKTEFNVLDIDFKQLLAAETDEDLAEMHRYFSALPPSEKNDYTGKYAGYNLILITAESFSHLAVRPDVTPTLYKLSQEGYRFNNFYTPLWGVSTSDGEYVACTGLIPKPGVWSFKHSADISLPLVMGNQMKKLGCSPYAYHNHTYTYYHRELSHPNMGYKYKAIGNGLDLKDTWPRSDLEMMEKTVSDYIGAERFHAYYMTVSGHLHYNFYGNDMAIKNRKYVEDLPYSKEAQAYLATQIEFDRAMAYLLEALEEAGVADRTLIAISADHYPYDLDVSAQEELAGQPITGFDLYRNSFILWAKDMEPVTIDEPCSSLDILPTLSNLLGLDYDSRLLMGRDIHSQTAPLVIFADGSFITAKGVFDANENRFEPLPGTAVSNKYIQSMLDAVARKTYFSIQILDNDYYGKVLPKP